ncbi:hypothetical protein [Streptomyces sp. cmx-10-25]|uniref:hypothetical protein n=1 Tax=Streptomyces sp. cmx-10-25 TaxID=2790919 RepID=UPI00397EE63E
MIRIMTARRLRALEAEAVRLRAEVAAAVGQRDAATIGEGLAVDAAIRAEITIDRLRTQLDDIRGLGGTAYYVSLGPMGSGWYETAVSEADAYAALGRNVLGGFVPVVHIRTAQGEPLETPDGERISVVVVTGASSGAVHGVYVLRAGER